MKKHAAFLAIVAMLPTVAHAAAPATYDPGRVLDQVKERPVAPPKKPAQIENEVGQPAKAPAEAAGVKVTVTSFILTGVSAFPASELQELLAPYKGKPLSLGELKQAVQKITGYYHEHGYFLAYAYLPPQAIKDGVVQITVLEGKLDKVRLNKGAGTRVSDAVILRGLRGVESKALIDRDVLDNRLQILSNLPGLDVNADLQPGSLTGTADLIVNVQEKRAIELVLDTDNYGNFFSGEYRGGATVNVNDPFGAGDQLSLRGLTSGEGLNNGRIGYLVPVGRYGTKLGASYSYLHYKLGEQFASLDQHGVSQVGSFYANQPLAVTRNLSLYGQLGYDYKFYEDSASQHTDRKHAHAGNGSLLMTVNDGLGGGGVTNVTAIISGGSLVLDNTLESNDAGPDTKGMYGKANLNLTRLQALPSRDTFVFFSFDGQKAFKNLDTTEKYSLGGPTAVRAYPGGEASGDDGFVGSAEFRQNLGFLKSTLLGDVQAVGFYDYGMVQVNDQGYTGGAEDVLRRSGAGVGLNWVKAGDFMLRASAAWATGAQPDQVSDGTHRSPRCWFQFVKWF